LFDASRSPLQDKAAANSIGHQQIGGGVGQHVRITSTLIPSI